VSERHVELFKLAVQAVLAMVLLIGMLWIILSPATNDAATKSALVIVSSAAGYIFGKNT
jgi:hypothetical protein